MLFPESAKKAFFNAFYDKEVSILADTETIDEEGGVVRETSINSSFKGNVRFNALSELQVELGLIKDIDIAITCPTETAVELNDVLQYNGIKYIATDVLTYDSHKLIVGKIWAKQ